MYETFFLALIYILTGLLTSYVGIRVCTRHLKADYECLQNQITTNNLNHEKRLMMLEMGFQARQAYSPKIPPQKKEERVKRKYTKRKKPEPTQE